MDALSLMLKTIRLTSPLIAQLRLADHVSLAIDGSEGHAHSFPFHYVVEGVCQLITDADGPTRLEQGDLMLMPNWPAVRLECGDDRVRFHMTDLIEDRRLPYWTEEYGLDVPILIPLGDGPVVATLLSGIFTFEGPQGMSLRKELPGAIHIRSGRHKLDALLNAALSFVVDEQEAHRPGFAAMASRLLEAALVEALRTWALETRHGAGRLAGMVDANIARALHAMHVRPGDHWTVTSLARVAGRSRSGFAAHFTQTVGTTPRAYLTNLRCQLAEGRLTSTNDSITTIGESLGYGSAYAFGRAFRAWSGLTPSRYRQQRRSA